MNSTINIEQEKEAVRQQVMNNFVDSVEDIATFLHCFAKTTRSVGALIDSVSRLEDLNQEQREKTVKVEPGLIEENGRKSHGKAKE
jgi:hypothetical protein